MLFLPNPFAYITPQPQLLYDYIKNNTLFLVCYGNDRATRRGALLFWGTVCGKEGKLFFIWLLLCIKILSLLTGWLMRICMILTGVYFQKKHHNSSSVLWILTILFESGSDLQDLIRIRILNLFMRIFLWTFSSTGTYIFQHESYWRYHILGSDSGTVPKFVVHI